MLGLFWIAQLKYNYKCYCPAHLLSKTLDGNLVFDKITSNFDTNISALH